MPVDWVTADHEPALRALEAGVRDRGGAVLVGPAGVGKTTLARQTVEHLGPADWVIATAPARAVPFGAFRDVVDIPAHGKTAAVLRAAEAALAGRLIVVDDAHLLDRLSATLLYRLALRGTTRLVVTVGGPAPDEVSALWKDDLLARVDVDPAAHDDARLETQVAEFLADLPAATRRAVHYLVVTDPVPLPVLRALVGDDAVADAQRHGLIAVDDELVRAGHPLFVDAARDELGGPDLRRMRTELVEKLAAAGPGGVVDRLWLAVIAAESDYALPADVMADAAAEALRLGDLHLSEQLGRAAVTPASGLATRLPLAYALAWQGRGRDADAVLAAVDPTDLSEDDLMEWALPRAANQFWMLSEPERATAFLRTVRARVSAPGARATVDALSATFAMNAGTPARAVEIATEVLATPEADGTAVGWAASAAALSCARLGRFDEVNALAERAQAADHPGLLRFTSGFGQTTALLMAGELQRALELARQLADVTQLQQPGQAIGEVVVADVLIARGELAAATELLRRATAELTPTGYSWASLAWMLLTQALGQQGATVEAGKALARAESRHGLKSMLFAPELGLARAWTHHARRDVHAAVAAARDAAKTAERGGQTALALRALLDAVRLGDVRAADTLARLDVGCVFGGLTLEYAKALNAGDHSALNAVAERFDAVGMRGAARDARRQAADSRPA
ncbi:AAA family ATPase [Mycobacterium sp. NPDC050551]|uniref:AAA family ATPase n=1 Tax=Mycobacterium sp. NPDC050551 TaxID=3155407 RepID=UPI003424A61D